MLMGSGECVFRSASVDITLLMQMAARADGQISEDLRSDQKLAEEAPGEAAGSVKPQQDQPTETESTDETNESATTEATEDAGGTALENQE